MYASFPADTFKISYNSWWIGEKYDGIRCCWNHRHSKLYSILFIEFYVRFYIYFFLISKDIAGLGTYFHFQNELSVVCLLLLSTRKYGIEFR